jgi:ribosomal protein S21
VPNKFVSAYFRELGKKGGKASGDKKRRSPEHYKKMVEIRKAKKALQKSS